MNAITHYLDFLSRKTYSWLAPSSLPTMSARVFPCDSASISFPRDAEQPEISSAATLEALKTAAHHLVNLREPVAFPTETVYGLGGLALDGEAATRIFTTKGRPADNPLIVHVSSFSMLNSILPTGFVMPPAYRILIARFWPGPLTLLFPADSTVIPKAVTAGHLTVAVRMPAHPIARALIAVADAPLAAPSANSSGRPSPTRAQHVARDLGTKLSVILDGGPCGVGLESTVVDGLNSDNAIRVLRPGGVTVEDIERALTEDSSEGESIPRVLVHRRDYSDEALEQAPTTPGMKYRHYSPSVPVTLLHTTPPPLANTRIFTVDELIDDITGPLDRASSCPLNVGILAPSDSHLGEKLLSVGRSDINWHYYPLGPTDEPLVTAQRLFDGLLTLDEKGVDIILAEAISEKREGLAVMNRARKAASDSRWIQLM
jgi:L-threonylcarbamoyladenylate synthase